jgi:hypothetical protein
MTCCPHSDQILLKLPALHKTLNRAGLSDQINYNEIGRPCGTYVIQKRRVQGFGRVTCKERDHLKDLGVDGMITLKLNFKKWDGEAWAG